MSTNLKECNCWLPEGDMELCPFHGPLLREKEPHPEKVEVLGLMALRIKVAELCGWTAHPFRDLAKKLGLSKQAPESSDASSKQEESLSDTNALKAAVDKTIAELSGGRLTNQRESIVALLAIETLKRNLESLSLHSNESLPGDGDSGIRGGQP